MITMPRLNQKQLEDLETMQKMEGWRIVTQAIEGSIEMGNIELINYKFDFDDDGNPTKKSIMKYQEKQKEVGLLKIFLQFVYKPAIITNESEETYE